MKDVIRAEFLKIRTTRTVYGLLVGMLVLIAFGVFSVLSGDPHEWRAVQLVDQGFLVSTGQILSIFVLMLGVRSFTDEFRHGSIVPTLLVDPRRGQILAGKVIAVATTSLMFAVAAYAVALAIALPRLDSQGADVGVATAAMAMLLGKVAFMSIAWSAVGVGFGLAVRHQVGAIVASFVWIMFAESYLEEALPDVAKYLPRHTMSALIETPGDLILRPATGGVVLAAWSAAAILLGAALMARRDIA